MDTIDTLTPKGKVRYEKLLDAATEVFYEQGYEKASMSEIVKRAGGSLATLYKIFGNKENLFIHILKNKTKNLYSGINDSIQSAQNVENFLYVLGKAFLNMVTTQEAVLFQRLIISEGYRNDAHLSNIFLKYAMGPVTKTIADFLESEKQKGKIDVDDSYIAAQQFIYALKEPLLFRRVLGLELDISEETIEKTLNQVVKIFTKGLKLD